MDFSRPDNARLINRIKILNAIRESGALSRADLSREVLINKVSISEIADKMIKEGLILEGEKYLTKGRPSTLLSVNADSGRVFVAEVNQSSFYLSAFDMLGSLIRFERIKRKEKLKDDLEEAIKKYSQSHEVYGIAFINKTGESIKLGYPSLTIDETEAEIHAETLNNNSDEKILFFSWSSSLSLTLAKGKYHIPLSSLNSFLFENGKTLADVLSPSSILIESGLNSIQEVINSDKCLTLPIQTLALLLSEAIRYTAPDKTVITGKLSAINDFSFEKLKRSIQYNLKSNGNINIRRSNYKAQGARIGAGVIALDRFFYHKSELNELEKLSTARFWN